MTTPNIPGGDHPTLRIVTISDPEHLLIPGIAELDQRVFKMQKALTEHDFRTIVARGGILFAHLEPSGDIVSEASLMLEADPVNGMSALERQLPAWLAYCDGAAVAEQYRGYGLQKHLLYARETVARDAGKQGIVASVRQRNIPSIRAMLSAGYFILADAPGYYGPNPEDDRVVMLKLFDIEDTTPTDMLSIAERAIVLTTRYHDSPDQDFNRRISVLLRSGYVGVACRPVATNVPEYKLLFVPIDAFSYNAASVLQTRKAELDIILNGSI